MRILILVFVVVSWCLGGIIGVYLSDRVMMADLAYRKELRRYVPCAQIAGCTSPTAWNAMWSEKH